MPFERVAARVDAVAGTGANLGILETRRKKEKAKEALGQLNVSNCYDCGIT